ncbi:Trm112 family protein [Hoeflea sp. AS60]|uniref:Trm112 family protein n=1 Tax=Hoeflea sp. AS60 TaxID=3135780 RepID=UPI0031742458
MKKEIEPAKILRSRGAVDIKMLELLVCPLTYGPLEFDPEKEELISVRANLAYPVRDGIPIMLVSEARQLPEDE